jgi:hypothetical protein
MAAKKQGTGAGNFEGLTLCRSLEEGQKTMRSGFVQRKYGIDDLISLVGRWTVVSPTLVTALIVQNHSSLDVDHLNVFHFLRTIELDACCR